MSDPRSPEYRHFLTPQQFAQRFGPTRAAIGRSRPASRSQGLTVGTPSSTGLSLPVSGTVAEVESAFSTSISRYRLASGNGVRQPVRTGGAGDGGAADRRDPRARHAQPAAAVHHAVPCKPARPPRTRPPSPPAWRRAADPPDRIVHHLHPMRRGRATERSTQTNWPRRPFDPLYAANHYGAGATVALVEMYGAGYSSSDISTFAACYGITLGGGQISEKNLPGGGATGPSTVEADLDIENVLSLAPKANIEVYEGGPSDSLYDVFDQIVSDDTAKIVSVQLDERMRGLRRAGLPEFGEHALRGGGIGGAVDLRRHRRPRGAGLQRQRGDLRHDGDRPGGPGRRPVDGDPLHRQQVEQHGQRGQ